MLREEESRKAEQARIRKEIEDAREKRLNEMKRLQQAEETLKLDYNELQSKDDLLQKYNKAVKELEELRKKEANLNTKVNGFTLQSRIVG